MYVCVYLLFHGAKVYYILIDLQSAFFFFFFCDSEDLKQRYVYNMIIINNDLVKM